MPKKPNESDWKHFRKVSPLALERMSQRALDELQVIVADESTSAHDRYLQASEQIQNFRKQMSASFDEFSRSGMTLQVIRLRKLELITDEEFEGFSTELQSTVANI